MTVETQSGYVVGFGAIIAGMTLNQWLAVAGLFGVVATFVFQLRRDRREELTAQFMLGKQADRRCEDRRCPTDP